MIRFVLFFLLSFPAYAINSFTLDRQPLGVLVTLYYTEVYQGDHVICDAVLNDARLVSVRLNGDRLDRAMVGSLLEAHGIRAVVRDGVRHVCTVPEAVSSEVRRTLVYRPMHRSVDYLVSASALAFSGEFVGRSVPTGVTSVSDRATSAPSSSSSYTGGDALDHLVYVSDGSDHEDLRDFLSKLDTPRPRLRVSAHVYEVLDASAVSRGLRSISASDGSLSSSSVSLDAVSGVLTFSGPLDVAFQRLEASSSLRLVSSPVLAVTSGETATLSVGDEIPVVSEIVVDQGGTTRQSVTYLSSGLSFEVSPVLRGSSVDVRLVQDVSSFSASTGAADNPTRSTRRLESSFVVDLGETVALGGLSSSRDTRQSSRSFFRFRASDSSSSELLLVIRVDTDTRA